jgi:NAD(P)-dependent dehydrogenase (short-subunit alcohol dehydrogenase family)
MKRFEGKTAVVTGGAQGIGLATAERLHGEGANVFIADIRAWEGSAASQSLARSGRIAYRQTDVSIAAEVEAMMTAAEAEFGAVDILVSNVGMAKSTPFLDLKEEEIETGFRTNLFSMIWCCQAAIRRMKQRGKGGAIVLMSSVNAVMAMPGFAIYNSSKGGIEQLTRVLSLEFAADGIRVNAVGPGTILTELAKNAVLGDEASRRRILSRTPLRRFGEAEEVASTVAFLASDDASYITGETIFIDGGRRALNYTVPVD